MKNQQRSGDSGPQQPAVDIGALCSRHFAWRDLLHCGETWQRLAQQGGGPSLNLPKQLETWRGLQELARRLLDPLVDRFGPVQLTYGFAGPELTRHIGGRIAPKLDQHAGSELDRNGMAICARAGQAVDLLVPGTASDQVATWIRAELPFDRLYFYGADRPLHLSFGPQHKRQVVAMVRGASGRLVPRLCKPWAHLSGGDAS